MLFAQDTSPEARRALLAGLRTSTPAQRARMIATAIRAARAMARAGVRRQSPEDALPAQHAAFLRRWLGPKWAALAFAEWQRRRDAASDRGDDGSR